MLSLPIPGTTHIIGFPSSYVGLVASQSNAIVPPSDKIKSSLSYLSGLINFIISLNAPLNKVCLLPPKAISEGLKA